MGTSYGGYSTLYTMVTYPRRLLASGIANSPPTDWRLYDAIYTERYMGLLGDNLAGYDSSAVLPFGEQPEQGAHHLLLIHSMMDDNVHPQNTMQLLTALTNAGVRRGPAHLSARPARRRVQPAERDADSAGDGRVPEAVAALGSERW